MDVNKYLHGAFDNPYPDISSAELVRIVNKIKRNRFALKTLHKQVLTLEQETERLESIINHVHNAALLKLSDDL